MPSKAESNAYAEYVKKHNIQVVSPNIDYVAEQRRLEKQKKWIDRMQNTPVSAQVFGSYGGTLNVFESMHKDPCLCNDCIEENKRKIL